jgi:uncharacterized protein YndB with AHSA1/START domain
MTDDTLRIERTFNASANEVFEAWTSPEVMRRWFHCGHDWNTLRTGSSSRSSGRRD